MEESEALLALVEELSLLGRAAGTTEELLLLDEFELLPVSLPAGESRVALLLRSWIAADVLLLRLAFVCWAPVEFKRRIYWVVGEKVTDQ